MANKDIPTWLSHKPIISAEYSNYDAKFLSIGRSTWNEEDVSAKIWRWAEDGKRWSRQSEELPLSRLLDLTKLLVATITGQTSSLQESVVNPEDKAFLDSFLSENMDTYEPKLEELRRLLTPKAPEQAKTPNIFSYATSELSQDAMLSWLIKWADDKYLDSDAEACKLGKSFLSLLTGMQSDSIHTVNVGRQWENIDVWVEINDDSFLIIEDKTETSIHDNQLNRYRQTVENHYKGKRSELYYAYLKTGNEPLQIEKEIVKQGYKLVNRQMLLSILNSYTGNNPIITDYRSHLQGIEDATNSYRIQPVNDWKWYAWQGFYKEIESRIEVSSWGYVANPSGGFLGMWWNALYNNEIGMYPQFEQSKFCIKISYEGESQRSAIRNKYHNKLMAEAKKLNLSLEKPDRFGAGTYMTIGVVKSEHLFGTGKVDMDALILKLKQYEELVKKCMES